MPLTSSRILSSSSASPTSPRPRIGAINVLHDEYDQFSPRADESVSLLSTSGEGEGNRDGLSSSSESEYMIRKRRSIRIVNWTFLLSSIGFSIILSTLWPYLETVGGQKSFLGWIVASYSLGQLLASPIAGVWTNYVGAKIPFIATLCLSIGSNAMYCFCDAFHSSTIGPWFMLSARFLAGFSGGNIVVARTYVARITTIEERTGAMATLGASQGIGFIIGPAIGSAFSPVKTGIEADPFLFNYLTAPGYISVLFYVCNLLVILFWFEEVPPPPPFERNIDPVVSRRKGTTYGTDSIPSDVMEEETENIFSEPNSIDNGEEYLPRSGSGYTLSSDDGMISPRVILVKDGRARGVDPTPSHISRASVQEDGLSLISSQAKAKHSSLETADHVAACVCMYLFFLSIFMFAIFETILVPFTMDEFNWSRNQADFLDGILLAVAGIVAVGVFLVAKPLSSRIGERLTLFIAYMISSVAFFGFIPWGNGNTPCSSEDWCSSIPGLPFPQFIAASFLVAIGYPLSSVIVYATFSKKIGSGSQGVYMGIITAVGSLARMIGPVYVSEFYTNFGPPICFGIVSAMLGSGLILGFFFAKKLDTNVLHSKYSNQDRLDTSSSSLQSSPRGLLNRGSRKSDV